MQDTSNNSGKKSRVSTPKKVALAVLGALTILTFANIIEAAIDKYGDRFDHDAIAERIEEHVIIHRNDHQNIRVETRVHSDERDADVMIEKSYNVGPGGLLSIAVGDADIQVKTHASETADIAISLEGRDMDRARAYFADQNFDVSRNGSTITIRTQPEKRNYSWNSTGGANISIDVAIPDVFNAEIKTSDGDIAMSRLEGNVVLHTSDGDITTEALQGSAITLRTSDGDIRTMTLQAKEVSVTTSDGDLILEDILADMISIRTSDGDIHAKDIRGKSSISTSDGDIRLVTASGSELAIRTSDGEIMAEELSADASQVQTSDGNITLRNVSGALTAKTSSGDLNVTLQNAGNVSLRTGDGDIYVKVPSHYAANLFLKGERVRLSSGFQFDGELKENQAEGRINGGGPTLEARTSDGEVVFREN